MRVRFIYMALLVWILSPVAIPADEQAPETSRWGITTKKNLGNSGETAPAEIVTTPAVENQGIKTHPSLDSPATVPSNSTDTAKVPSSGAPATADDIMPAKPTQKTVPTKIQLPEEKAAANKEPSTSAANKEITPQAIKWSSEKQKERCDGYLQDLRSLFLKTRHFSIQGASCDTAVNAAAFLKSMETCQQNCPPGLLEHSGYTKRIIRNIRYLEKLGNDRCSGTLTPLPPVTQTP